MDEISETQARMEQSLNNLNEFLSLLRMNRIESEGRLEVILPPITPVMTIQQVTPTVTITQVIPTMTIPQATPAMTMPTGHSCHDYPTGHSCHDSTSFYLSPSVSFFHHHNDYFTFHIRITMPARTDFLESCLKLSAIASPLKPFFSSRRFLTFSSPQKSHVAQTWNYNYYSSQYGPKSKWY